MKLAVRCDEDAVRLSSAVLRTSRALSVQGSTEHNMTMCILTHEIPLTAISCVIVALREFERFDVLPGTVRIGCYF